MARFVFVFEPVWEPVPAFELVAAFAVNAFAAASVAPAAPKGVLNTTTKVADLPVYGRSGTKFFNVKLVAAVATKDIALENNGSGSFSYAKFYGAGDYKFAKATAEGAFSLIGGGDSVSCVNRA